MRAPHDKVGHRDGSDWRFPADERVPVNKPFRGLLWALIIEIAVIAIGLAVLYR